MPNDSVSPFHLQLTHHDGCAVIHCMGRLLAEQADQLETLGSRELCSGRRVILDLNAVVEVDPSGIGAISHLYRYGLRAHCPVVILGGSAHLHRLLNHLADLDAHEPSLHTAASDARAALDEMPHGA